MLSLAHPAMRAQLERIWRLCFGDPQAYIELFFRHRFRPEDTLVWLQQGQPVAMAFALPVTLQAGALECPARYLYAVATHPQWQGRGISTRLLEEGHALLAGRGAQAAILVPASGSLFGFYGKRGFQTQFYMRETVVEAGGWAGAQPLPLAPGTLVGCRQLREQWLGRYPLFNRWGQQALAYQDREAAFGQGGVWQFEGGYALCYPWQGTLYVKELIGQPDFPALAAALARRYPVERVVFRQPGQGEVPFAMVRWYGPQPTKQPGAFSLALE